MNSQKTLFHNNLKLSKNKFFPENVKTILRIYVFEFKINTLLYEINILITHRLSHEH